jgi:hypothetical protein
MKTGKYKILAGLAGFAIHQRDTLDDTPGGDRSANLDEQGASTGDGAPSAVDTVDTVPPCRSSPATTAILPAGVTPGGVPVAPGSRLAKILGALDAVQRLSDDL